MAERVKVEATEPKKVDPKFTAGPIEEKLEPVAEKEPGDELEDSDEELPKYKREPIGPRLQDHALNTGDEKESIEDIQEKLDTDDMVPLLFPRKVMLQDKGIMHTWEAGVHMVPAALAGHWYLKQHRVKKAGPVQKAQKTE